MTEPRRLLSDPEASKFERDLLGSWSSEAPSLDARARALAIVAGAVAGTVAGTATASSATSGTAGAVATAKVGAFAGVSGAAKMGFLGMMVVVAAIVSVTIVRRSRDIAPMPPPAVATEAVHALVPPPAPTMDVPSVSPADLPAAPSAAVSTVTAPSPSTSTRAQGAAGVHVDPPSSVTDEVAGFDRARAALEAGEVDRALALLDAYERRFPSGMFVQEAEVLRVKALAAKGDLTGARRTGERFLAAHPTSPHAQRIRAILDSSPP